MFSHLIESECFYFGHHTDAWTTQVQQTLWTREETLISLIKISNKDKDHSKTNRFRVISLFSSQVCLWIIVIEGHFVLSLFNQQMIHQVSCLLLPYFYCEISKISLCWFSCHSASWPLGGAQLRPCLLHQIHSWFSSSLSSPLSSFPFFLFFILLYFVFSSFSGSVSFHLPHSFCPSHSTSSFFLSSSSSVPFSSSSLPSFPAATHFVIFRFVLLFSFLFITCAAADASHYSHTVVWNISGLSLSSSSCLLRLFFFFFIPRCLLPPCSLSLLSYQS